MRVARLLVLGKQGRRADRPTDRRAGEQTDRQLKARKTKNRTRNRNRDDVKEVQIEGFGRKRTKASITCG